MTTRFPSWDIETQNRILAEARREQAKVFAKYLRLAFTGVAHLVTAVFQSIARAVVQARQLSELTRLSDRQLADMGISRSDIPSVVLGEQIGIGKDRVVVTDLRKWTRDRASNDWHGSAAA